MAAKLSASPPRVHGRPVTSTILMIIVFFAGQRYFAEGIVTQGGRG